MKKMFAMFAFVLPLISHATSFNCKKAESLVENVICSDKNLSKLDDTLASIFKDAMKTSGNSTALRDEEVTWLSKRDACQDKICIKVAYEERINELVSQAAHQTYKHNNPNNFPKTVGDCVETILMSKNTRFEGVVAGDTGGEVNVMFDNEIALYIQEIQDLPKSTNVDKYMYSTSDFAEGDSMKLCLLALPKDCPKGDDRGKVYSVHSHKNNKTFTGVDAWHLCGGA